MEGSLEARLQRLEDLAAIHQLFIDYGEHLDAGDFEAYAELFAPDGEALLGPMGRVKGRAAIKELMVRTLGDSVGTTFHIVSSPRVDLRGDTATSTVMWTVVAIGDDGQTRVTMLGHHVDDLARIDGRWYIARRKGVMNAPKVFSQPRS